MVLWDMETTDWPTNLYTDGSKKVLHIVLKGWLGLGLRQGVSLLPKSLESFLAAIV